MNVETQLLESYLKRLGLTTFLRNHSAFAVDAAQSQHSYSRYLLALAEQELAQRAANSRQRRLKEAKLPLVKTLNDFDFTAMPLLNQQRLVQLAQGEYIGNREPVILVGNPGLGKTHVATGSPWPLVTNYTVCAFITPRHWSTNCSPPNKTTV